MVDPLSVHARSSSSSSRPAAATRTPRVAGQDGVRPLQVAQERLSDLAGHTHLVRRPGTGRCLEQVDVDEWNPHLADLVEELVQLCRPAHLASQCRLGGHASHCHGGERSSDGFGRAARQHDVVDRRLSDVSICSRLHRPMVLRGRWRRVTHDG